MSCVEFSGRTRRGTYLEYGGIRIDGRWRLAHRVAYERAYGEIPPRHDVHHECGNKLCVNPEHLVAKPRSLHLREHKTKERCIRGHSLSEAKVYRSKRGTVIRNCLACARVRRREKAT